MRLSIIALLLVCFHAAKAARCTDESLRRNFPNSLKGKNITVVTLSVYPPFIKRDGLGVPCGFDIDLMNLIGSIYRIQFHYEYVSVANLIREVQGNTQTISISNQIITEERMQLVKFVQFFRAGMVFIAKSSFSGTINRLTDACGQRVAVLDASLHQTILLSVQNSCAENPIRIVTVATFPELLAAVSNDTAALGFVDEPVLKPVVIDSNGQLKLLGGPYYVTPRGILCNKENQPLCCLLTNAINYLIEEGLYGQLLERYSFSYKNNGVCPSRLNLEGTTCRAECVPSKKVCRRNLN